MKELKPGPMAPVGYPVPRRAVLAGPVAAGVLAWASRLTGPAAAQTSSDLGGAGGPANVRVSRDAFTMHAEPSLAANPADPRNLLAACMVWQAGRRGLATYASFDAGSTWHSNGLLPGVTPAYDGDVTVAFDGHGTGYVSGWAGSRAAEQRGRACLWRTADGGRSFTTPVTVATGLLDHPSLAADRWARSGPATLYVAGTTSAAAGWRSPGPPTGGTALSRCASPTPAATHTAVALR